MSKHTEGPWAVEADPMDDRDYETMIVLPNKSGGFGTWIARAEHNWNEASAGEHRISWAEAQANARLIAAAPELLEALEATTHEVESVIRLVSNLTVRDEMQAVADKARSAIAKATGAA